MPDDLAGKVALVTGAASGIGRATARMLASQGARVFAADRDPANGTDADSLVLDVRSPEDWRAAEARIGRLDILVNAAGISRTAGEPHVAEVAIEDWREVFAVNVEGTLLGCQMAMRAMAARGGAIVNLASVTALTPTATLGAYGASKAAVVQLTRSIAIACAAAGLPIRCNCIEPGMVDTPMIAAMPPPYRAAWEAEIPAGRFARPEEIAAAILYLAGDAASYVNGTALLVDGGLINRAVVRAGR